MLASYSTAQVYRRVCSRVTRGEHASYSIATCEYLKSNARVPQIQHAIPSDSTRNSLGFNMHACLGFSDSGATSYIQDIFVSQSTTPYRLEILSMVINTWAYPLQV